MNEENYSTPHSAEEAVFQQLALSRKQYLVSRITAAAACATAVVVTCTSLWMVYTLGGISKNLRATSDNLRKVTEDLSEADLSQAVEQIQHTAKVSEEGIGTALEKINSIDIDELNESIHDFHDAVVPLKNLLGIFGGRN